MTYATARQLYAEEKKELFSRLCQQNPFGTTFNDFIPPNTKTPKLRKARGESAKKHKIDGMIEKMKKYSLVQPTLKETVVYNQPWGKDNPNQTLREQYLIQWLADDMLPYRAVENERLQKLLSHLNKKFLLPSEKVIRQRLMPELYCKLQYGVTMAE